MNNLTFSKVSMSMTALVLLAVFSLAGCGGGANTQTVPDTTPPTVSSVSPANSATAVTVNTAITATFSKTMDASTVTTTTFTLNNGVTGAVTYSGTTATFTPSSNLADSTAYTATITTDVKDAAGNAMASPYTWTFTTGATQTSDAEINSLASDMRSAFGADNISAVSKSLGLAGIVVYSDDMSQPSASLPGTRMLKAQARGMAMELSNGAGFTGAVLNTLAPSLPLKDGTLVPVSQLLAAYIAHGDTYGARQSRALLPGLDPAKHLETVFPTIAIVFFMKDFVVPLLAAAQDPDAVNMALAAGVYAKAFPLNASVASDPCGAVSEFLDKLDDSVRDAVQNLIDPGHSSVFLSFVSSVMGSIVEFGTDTLKSLIRHLPFVNALREVANVLGTLTDMQSLFSQWEVTITPPSGLHKNPGIPNAGVFTLTMDNGGDGFEWPQAVTSCADLFGISLPQLDSADGSSVDWVKVSGFDDLGSSTSQQKGVIAGNQATYSVVSATESADLHNGGGSVDTGDLAVRADVQMPGVEQLATRIGSLIGSLGKAAADVAAKVAPHIGPSAPGVAQVEFHKPASARINFDGEFERLTASSPDGINPNGTWTGTFARNMGLLCGGWVEQPVSWTFTNGTATLAVDLTFPGNADFAIEACSFSFTETLTLESSDQGPFVSTSGTYDSMFDPGWPGIDYPDDDPPLEVPPVITSGDRGESYVVEMVEQPLSTVVRKRSFLAFRTRSRVTTNCKSFEPRRYRKFEHLEPGRSANWLEFITDRPVFMTFLPRSDDQICAVSQSH